jgi:hypothetical protein
MRIRRAPFEPDADEQTLKVVVPSSALPDLQLSLFSER